MSSYSILIHPHKNLRISATPIHQFDNRLAKIVERMFETMYAAHGIGLAATQVDIHQRIVVIDTPIMRFDEQDDTEKQQPIAQIKKVLINPELIAVSEETAIFTEGCLSLPNQFAEVKRPKKIRYRYQDLGGAVIEEEAENLPAVCIQHEIDHLNGILFIDHLSRLKRERIEKKLHKEQKRHDN